MVEDIDDVDTVEPRDFVLYFDDERWRDGLLELIFMMNLTALLVRKARRASLCSVSHCDLVTWETVARW